MPDKARITFVDRKGLTKFSGYFFRVKKEISLVQGEREFDVEFVGLSSRNHDISQHLPRIKSELIGNPTFVPINSILKQRRLLRDDEIVHSQGQRSFFHCWLATRFLRTRPKIVFDYHGAGPEEYLVLGGNIFGYLLVKFWEWLGVTQSDALIVVSESHREYLLEKYEIEPAKIFVVRNFVEDTIGQQSGTDKYALRKKLGLPLDKKIVTYSGNFQRWQEPNLIRLIAQSISQQSNGSIFLLLSRDPEARELSNGESVIHRSVDREEVFQYLRASDVGLLLRRSNKINRFADPTKLAEYLSCGLTLFSSGVGDLEKVILKNPQVGYFFAKDLDPPNKLLQDLMDFISSLKTNGTNEESLKTYRQQYTSEIARERLLGCYRQVLNTHQKSQLQRS